MPGTVVHLLFDVYLSNSLKHHERKLRGEDSTPSFVIAGPDQSPEVSMNDLLANTSFKEAFQKFLEQEWTKEKYIALLHGKTVIVSHGG